MGEKRVVENEVVKLDYMRLENTIYRRCTLVFSGGLPPEVMPGVDMIECRFVFDGAAENTRAFMILLSLTDPNIVVKQMLQLPNWGPIGDEQ